MTGTYIYDLNAKRILTLYDRAREIKKGLIPPPRMAIIYPNYLCNYDCPGCEYAIVNRQNKSQMDLSRFLTLLDELRDIGVDSVELCGGGEPTLYPYLQDVILHGRRRGLSFGLLTNGSCLGGEMAMIVARELSYVRISLDAATNATYLKVKRPTGADFNSVIANIQDIMRQRKRIKSQLLISIKFLVSQLNRHEIPAAFELAQTLKVDSLQFKALRQSAYSLTPKQQDRAAARIRRLKDAYPGLNVLGGVGKINASRRCWLSPLQTTIDACGDVFLCCYYLHRRPRHCIGNIHKNSFREIWGSPRHLRAISAIRPAECNLLDCRFVNYMKVLEPLLEDSRHQIDFI
ncbi:MAG TPA: radical SAM protein [Smithella sp.]|nr:radical SAM protein [Smithella sp.]